MFYLIIRSLAVVLFKIFFHLDVFGRENIPAKGGFLLAANHASYLDPPMAAAACPRVVFFLAMEALFKNKLFGHFIKSLHAFPLKSHCADLMALRWAIAKLKSGKIVVIFPEGRRSVGGQLHEPLTGVGLLAVKANAPVVPVFIEGTDRAMPAGGESIRFFSKVRVHFGTPIYPENSRDVLEKRHYENLTKKTMEKINALKNKANQQKGVDE